MPNDLFGPSMAPPRIAGNPKVRDYQAEEQRRKSGQRSRVKKENISTAKPFLTITLTPLQNGTGFKPITVESLVIPKRHSRPLAEPKPANYNRKSFTVALQAHFKEWQDKPISTFLSSGPLAINLAHSKGITFESFVEGFLILNKIEYKKSHTEFPDFLVKTKLDDWVPVECKEESMDTVSKGRTNTRIARVGSVVSAIAKCHFFEAIILTCYKTSDNNEVTLKKLEAHSVLELIAPTPTYPVGFDKATGNIKRSSGVRFKNKTEAVKAIIELAERPHNNEQQLKDLAAVRTRYSLKTH